MFKPHLRFALDKYGPKLCAEDQGRRIALLQQLASLGRPTVNREQTLVEFIGSDRDSTLSISVSSSSDFQYDTHYGKAYESAIGAVLWDWDMARPILKSLAVHEATKAVDGPFRDKILAVFLVVRSTLYFHCALCFTSLTYHYLH